MVEVNYISRLGNNLFQYCMGRIIAENLGYKLSANSIKGFPHTKKKIDGKNYLNYPVQRLTGQLVNLKKFLSDTSKRKIIVDGYFQRYEYYKPYKDKIRKDWLKCSYSAPQYIHPNDVVLCIRRDDYVPLHALPTSFYEEALSSMGKVRKLFICTDSHDAFVSLFRLRYSAVVCPTNTLDNFRFIMKFKKIIISNSSYYWWASFLSNAEKIIAPRPIRGYWSSDFPGIDLEVDDEKRYVFINCKDVYKENILEKLIYIKRKLRL